jgi:hypothetical protein
VSYIVCVVPSGITSSCLLLHGLPGGATVLSLVIYRPTVHHSFSAFYLLGSTSCRAPNPPSGPTIQALLRGGTTFLASDQEARPDQNIYIINRNSSSLIHPGFKLVMAGRCQSTTGNSRQITHRLLVRTVLLKKMHSQRLMIFPPRKLTLSAPFSHSQSISLPISNLRIPPNNPMGFQARPPNFHAGSVRGRLTRGTSLSKCFISHLVSGRLKGADISL